MVIYMERSSIESLTPKDIKKIIDENFLHTKYEKLNRYYAGEHDILNYIKNDPQAPNNKIVHNMAKYITDTSTGYFIGKPVIYNSENEEFLEVIMQIYSDNDEQDHNTELAKQTSIFGECPEMLYLDEDCNIRFAKVYPGNVLMIYETDAPYTSPLAVIRRTVSTDKDKNIIARCEFWTDSIVMYFESFNGGAYNLYDMCEHYWQDVPFVLYINNEERIGDFENEISEIDAYNKAQSNTANTFEYNDDSIMTITNLGDVSNDDVRQMKEDQVVLIPENGEISWLQKQINDTALENYKKRLLEDIHNGSATPNMNDEAFGGNLSGISISYKLWGLEQKTGIKERKFKRSLQRRLKLICNILKVFGKEYDYKDITMKFRRNKPQNITEIADIITKLASDLSRETKLELLPFIEDVKEELRRLSEEQNMELESFETYQNLAKAFDLQEPEERTPLEVPEDES